MPVRPLALFADIDEDELFSCIHPSLYVGYVRLFDSRLGILYDFQKSGGVLSHVAPPLSDLSLAHPQKDLETRATRAFVGIG
jgi:hypothetical protein